MISSSEKTSKLRFLIFFINPIIGVKYLNDCNKETYSVYVEDR